MVHYQVGWFEAVSSYLDYVVTELHFLLNKGTSQISECGQTDEGVRGPPI